jgi:hypothetical protein
MRWSLFLPFFRTWSLAAGCLPRVSQYGIVTREPTAFDRDDLVEWIPYAGEQIPQGLYRRQPSNAAAVYKSLCELSTIIHSFLYVMYADADSLTDRDIFDRYSQLLGWYGSLPEALRLGENSTPSVLFVQ